MNFWGMILCGIGSGSVDHWMMKMVRGMGMTNVDELLRWRFQLWRPLPWVASTYLLTILLIP
jgi:hypothetical protein